MILNNFTIRPFEFVPADKGMAYINDLKKTGNIRKRLCDVEEPGLNDFIGMVRNPANRCYAVLERNTRDMVAEFMFENYIGAAAQVHFSMHSENGFKKSVDIADSVTNFVLSDWTVRPTGSTEDVPYLETIFGLTPVTNRAACLFVLKAGFKKVGILPSGINDRGEIVDAMITTKTRQEVLDGR